MIIVTTVLLPREQILYLFIKLFVRKVCLTRTMSGIDNHQGMYGGAPPMNPQGMPQGGAIGAPGAPGAPIPQQDPSGASLPGKFWLESY